MNTIRQITWDGVGGLKTYDTYTYSSLKYDGSEYLLHIKNHKAYALTSKRVSKKTGVLSEKLDNIPQLKEIRFPFVKETIIVCEVVAEHLRREFEKGVFVDNNGNPFRWNSRCNFVASEMNKTATGFKSYLKLVAHDIIMVEGKDVSAKSFKEKIHILEKKFPSAGLFGDRLSCVDKTVFVLRVEKTVSDIEVCKFFETCVSMGYEGTIVNDGASNLSAKLKREASADLIITGFTEGTNKYAENGWIGAICVAVIDDDKLPKSLRDATELNVKYVKELKKKEVFIDMGKLSGFDEGLRAEISNNRDKYIGKIIEVKFMEFTGKKMRHPRFMRFRTDKFVWRCSMDQFVVIQ